MRGRESALMDAASRGATDKCLEACTESDVDVNCHDRCKEGWTPLILAARHGHADTVAALAKIPWCDVNIVNSDGRSALSFACMNDQADAVEVLIKCRGIRLNIPVRLYAQLVVEGVLLRAYSARMCV